jgi:two-component system response regulator AtoC
MSAHIAVIDDDPDFLYLMEKKLQDIGYHQLQLYDDPLKLLVDLKNDIPLDLALIDMNMPHMDGLSLMEHAKTINPNMECIMVTAVNEARVAVACINKGAYDYLLKPVLDETLEICLKRALERKRLLDILHLEKTETLPALDQPEAFLDIITTSKKVLRVLREAELHAVSDVPILITGESGTGKELLARAIHRVSHRAEHFFTPINMAALSGSLFEAEFFGHTKGAFTGAERSRAGYLEHTHKGTLFLDEISDLPVELQGKLLRVLQDGEYTRLGSSRSKQVDIRLIAATNANLEEMIRRKKFRKDLYYRIRGGWLHLPPLRERDDDIPLLADHFLNKFCPKNKQSQLDSDALALLTTYSYPGNIRELAGIIQAAVNLAQCGRLTVACLPVQVRKTAARIPSPTNCVNPLGKNGIVPLEVIEKQYILNAYKITGENKSQTARLLKIGLNTLRRKLKIYGM